jgi:hypothetical protein
VASTAVPVIRAVAVGHVLFRADVTRARPTRGCSGGGGQAVLRLPVRLRSCGQESRGLGSWRSYVRRRHQSRRAGVCCRARAQTRRRLANAASGVSAITAAAMRQRLRSTRERMCSTRSSCRLWAQIRSVTASAVTRDDAGSGQIRVTATKCTDSGQLCAGGARGALSQSNPEPVMVRCTAGRSATTLPTAVAPRGAVNATTRAAHARRIECDTTVLSCFVTNAVP